MFVGEKPLLLLVTHSAGFAIAGSVQTAFAIIPVFAMGVEADGSTSGTVAVEADIALRMTGLAGGQIFARIAGVVDRPGMEVPYYRITVVTDKAVRISRNFLVNDINIATDT